jgi:hypothetical protein
MKVREIELKMNRNLMAVGCDVRTCVLSVYYIDTGYSTLKGRTTKSKPFPPLQQAPQTLRGVTAEHMHAEILFVKKKPFLMSLELQVKVNTHSGAWFCASRLVFNVKITTTTWTNKCT